MAVNDFLQSLFDNQRQQQQIQQLKGVNPIIEEEYEPEEETDIADEKRNKLLNNIFQTRQANNNALEQSQNLLQNTLQNDSIQGGSGNKAVDIAKQYLGIPYKWGGNTPQEGMDCSGYMKYVYGQLGVDLPRVTYDQIKVGQGVNKENLMPGDLVFFGSQSDPHHVGMYIGNGQYIHEPKTGDVAKISNLNSRSDFVTGRRVM